MSEADKTLFSADDFKKPLEPLPPLPPREPSAEAMRLTQAIIELVAISLEPTASANARQWAVSAVASAIDALRR